MAQSERIPLADHWLAGGAACAHPLARPWSQGGRDDLDAFPAAAAMRSAVARALEQGAPAGRGAGRGGRRPRGAGPRAGRRHAAAGRLSGQRDREPRAGQHALRARRPAYRVGRCGPAGTPAAPGPRRLRRPPATGRKVAPRRSEMGEYEPHDSRNVTLKQNRAPGEPPRTGPQEAATRQQQQGETELEQDERGEDAEQTADPQAEQALNDSGREAAMDEDAEEPGDEA